MASKANLKSSGREAALARRRALSNQGKSGVAPSAAERTRGGNVRRPTSPAPVTSPKLSSAAHDPGPVEAPLSLRPAPASPRPVSSSVGRPVQSPSQASRALARQRRNRMAQDGRRGVRSGDRVRDAASVPGAKVKTDVKGRSGDCKCGCNGNKDRTATAPTSADPASMAQAPSLAPAPSNHGKPGQRVRANPALAAKPTGRAVALARRHALRARGKNATNLPTSAAGIARQANPKLSGRELAQKVRAARSVNGGAGERKSAPTGRMRPSRARGAADQPWKVGASETAQGQVVTGTRVGRSVKTTGDEPSTCRAVTGTEYMGAEIFREFCQTDPQPRVPKVGVTSTGYGNTVTGNEVGRSSKVTGDEPGTCKTVTGTQYLAPEQYAAYCDTRPAPEPRETGVGKTRRGQSFSGTMVGRAAKVTGDEAGAGVVPTGTQYTSATDIPSDSKVPPKVGVSNTLSGGTVTGNRVGRSAKVTGDEPGSCRVVTGDEYVDQNQYAKFCQINPQPEPPKVGLSATSKGQRVSGTQTGRSGKVTGDEPGTCKAVTGTPYAGLEQAADYCAPGQQNEIRARTRQLAATPGPMMTGIQPGIPAKGTKFTGAGKGACEPLTGTPYVGKDQFAEACAAAEPGDADFPRLLNAGAPAASRGSGTRSPQVGTFDDPEFREPGVGQGFSVQSPARAAFQAAAERRHVTGTQYESGGAITGPFGMATGKITGTEQFRFDAKRPRPDLLTMETPAATDATEAEAAPAAPPVSRVTGEGQSAGGKITGDDWDRGERVTGTEGSSARRRNPTRPGPMSAMPAMDRKRNDDVPEPVSRVTGSAGSTDRGALITFSGGARG